MIYFVYSKDIANLSGQFKLCITDIRKLPSDVSFVEDWDMATKFLTEKGYFQKTIYAIGVKSTSTQGRIFAHPQCLQTLSQQGYLTIFNSIHKLNVQQFNLFTFIGLDSHGI